MKTHTPIASLRAIAAGAAVAMALTASPALAAEGDIKPCDSDPSASACRMGGSVYSVGDTFDYGGLRWQVMQTSGGHVYRVEIKTRYHMQ